MLEANKTLKEIVFNNNRLVDKGAQTIGKVLRHRNEILTIGTLEGNDIRDDFIQVSLAFNKISKQNRQRINDTPQAKNIHLDI